MKEGIHPNYEQVTIECSCGNIIQTGSTRPIDKIDVCSACHPFYTGKQKVLDALGTVQKFKKKFSAKLSTRSNPSAA